ncbi:MAG: hypothetical protein V1704_00580 [Candidatus Vogelbacteria bacterium]
MNPTSPIKLIAITSVHLWIIFGVVIALFVGMSLILFYHWRRYRFGNAGVIMAGTIYLAVSALLIVLAFTALVAP